MRAASHFFFTAADLAHKTGALGGIRFDASILCLSSNRTDVPAFERLMQDVVRDLAAEQA